MGPDRVCGDDTALDAGVRVLLHERSVLVRAGLALVRVDDQVVGLGGRAGRVRLRHKTPLYARGKTSAPAPSQVSLLRLIDDLLPRHSREDAPRYAVAIGAALVRRESEPGQLSVKSRQVVSASEHVHVTLRVERARRNRVDAVRRQVLVVLVVDLHHGRRATAQRTLRRSQGEKSIRSRFAAMDA